MPVINFGSVQAPVCEVDHNSRPGVYISQRGSILIYPNQNISVRGRTAKKSGYVMVHDVDTGLLVMKKIDSLKGLYKFYCSLDELQINLPAQLDNTDL